MSEKDQILPQKPVRIGVRCVAFAPLRPPYDLALITMIVYHGGGRGKLETGPGLASVKALTPSLNTLINPQKNWKRLSHFPP